jgi:divalent metal cation (Fe/Co/Zn/Cd) transporter
VAVVGVESLLRPAERARLERRARLLAWLGNAWHLVEFAIALGAGLAAGSLALVAFGADSLIEGVSGFVIVWLFTGARSAAYVAVEAVRDLAGGGHAEASWVGIGLAAFTAPTMPLLARAKRDVGRRLGSSATVSEAGQNMICAYLSVALLVGLLANALAGWWWADPAAALVIAAVAAREARESWRGESCGCC